MLYKRIDNFCHHQLLMPHCAEFTLAGVTVALQTPRPVTMTENFRPFAHPGGRRRITVEVREVARLPELHTAPVFENILFSVFPDGDGYLRRYHDHKEHDRPYAVTRLLPDENRVRIDYLAGDGEFFCESQNCFSHIALEELLLHCSRLILHAAFVDTGFGGLLFSGPSGIGKSTQAALWEQYALAQLINGDKTILNPETSGWWAHGSPYAGSSRCFVNRSLPVRAIVMLEQGVACTLRRLPAGEAFRKLYANTIVNSWNVAYVARVCALLSELAAAVPVYHLTCTPDKAAVDTLRAELERTPRLPLEGKLSPKATDEVITETRLF